MINRLIINKLVEWKNKPDRKPLIIRGARQVGKTTAVDIFSKEFKNYVYLNMERNEDASIITDRYSIDEIFQAMLVIKKIEYKKGYTLIFIDEIQNSPVAIKMLRYFYEERKDLHVIAAGSLLEILLQKQMISFPVGRVEFLYMYPLTFKEFLYAKDEGEFLKLYDTVPMNEIIHKRALKLFHEYTLIGGMPEIVATYIQNKNISLLKGKYGSLMTSLLEDSEKYARNETMRRVLQHCLQMIPLEAGNRIKFNGFGKSNYRSREISEALRTIERAMISFLIYPTTSVQIPLLEDRKKSPKLQFFDTGLLNFFAGLQEYYFQYDDLSAFYKGKISEHIVRQELTARDMTENKRVLFWTREKSQATSEVDIVMQYKNHIIPVEVKSGKAGTLRSLHQFINRSGQRYAVRVYAGEFNIQKGKTPEGNKYTLMNLPYYLTAKIYDYLELLVHS